MICAWHWKNKFGECQRRTLKSIRASQEKELFMTRVASRSDSFILLRFPVKTPAIGPIPPCGEVKFPKQEILSRFNRDIRSFTTFSLITSWVR